RVDEHHIIDACLLFLVEKANHLKHLLQAMFFFFLRSCDLRDLHSFPTRRSSDLPGTCPAPRRNRRPGSSAAARRCPAGARRPKRSEEHTSELQSLAYLVCRLLLEKKKNEVNNDSPHIDTELVPPSPARQLGLRRS